MMYNEELYRIIIESSQDLIWILDKKGKFTFFNKRCEERNGTDLSDIIGKDYFSLIHQEDISRLFWSFEQLDSGMSRKYGGTGLGLAISDKLAKLHGGRIEVNSEYGKGSTFILMLPLRMEKQCSKQ